MPIDPAAPKPSHRAVIVSRALIALSLCMLLSSLSTSIANVALPTLAEAFRAPFQTVQWVVLAYLLSITALIVVAGRLSDLVGRRRLLLQGLSVFVVASAAAAASPNLWCLIAARAAQGMGAAVMMVLSMAFVGEAVPREKTGSAMGLLGTMSAVGTALGPTLGGALISIQGWRSIFTISVLAGMTAFCMVYRFLPVDPRARKGSGAGIDWFGSVLLAGALILYALSMTLGRGRFGLLNLLLLAGAVLIGGLFLIKQARSNAPLIPLHLIRTPAMSAGLISSLLVSTVVMATLVVGPFYLAGALDLNTATVGLAMSAGPVVAALAGMPSGRLVDRFGPARMTMVGLLIVVGGALGLSFMPLAARLPGYLLPITVITGGYALFQTANNTGVMSGLAADQRGVISGMLNLSRNLGLITGAAAMGAVFAIGAGGLDLAHATPDEVSRGMRLTFIVAAGLVGLAVAMNLVSRSRGAAVDRDAVVARESEQG